MAASPGELARALATALLPHFTCAAAGLGDADASAVAVLHSLKRVATVSAGTPFVPAFRPPGNEVARWSRAMTTATYLRRLHVPVELAALLPDMSAHLPRDTMRSKTNQVFFKRAVTIVDGGGRAHAVTYESLVSAGQRHTRLSSGWSAFCRGTGLRVGDTVVLELRGARTDGVLHARREAGSAKAA